MLDASASPSFDRSYKIGRLKHQARMMRLDAARAASALAIQLTDLADAIEAEASALERGSSVQRPRLAN